MKIPKPGLFILLLMLLPAMGCFVIKSKEDKDISEVSFARKNAELIKEMAEYAVMFCKTNKISSFSTEQVEDKMARKKLSQLGGTISVFYSGNDYVSDSVVTFKYITIPHGVLEYVYDFATFPKNTGDEKQPGEEVRIQVTERIYYVRRQFPMM